MFNDAIRLSNKICAHSRILGLEMDIARRRPGYLAALASGTRLAWQHGDDIQQAGRTMAKWLSKRRKPLPRRGSTSKRRKLNPTPRAANQAGSGPITSQSDVKSSRGFKKLSRKQRIWKNFVKKVHKAETSNEKTHFLIEVHNDPISVLGIVGTQYQQPVFTTASADETNLILNSVGNVATGPARFAAAILEAQPSVTTAAQTPRAAAEINQVFTVTYANCTISIENVAATQTYVDIYECVAATHIHNATYSSARAAWVECLTQTVDDYTGISQSLVNTTSGATPYQAPNFFKYWKVVKKTRILMTTNEIVNYRYSCRKNVHVINDKQRGRYATKGVTKDLIIVANPTYNGDTTVDPQLKIEWSKSYGIKYPDMQGIQVQLANSFQY